MSVDLPAALARPGALRIGLGCSNLGSDVGYREGRALVEIAYDCGFRHFDVAPPYGRGTAERIVGDALASVRDNVSITTKTGIAHPRERFGMRLARQALAPVKWLFPVLWSRGAAQARQAVSPRGRFGRADIVASVAESLEKLRCDRIDYLLLHEVQPDDVGMELLATLDGLRSDGLVARFGLGTSADASGAILGKQPDWFDLVQVNQYWGAYRDALQDGRHMLVTHRSIRTGMELIRNPLLQAALESTQAGSDVMQMLRDPAMASDLLLATALERNRHGLLLVSSSRPERLKRFVAVAQSDEFADHAKHLDAALAHASGSIVIAGS